eukprot:TRINITY_DN4042_c0_g1_i1.p1 TRINITY_DN4042_c0_g1~~TRINITY_DN4042_c0_g1_i1.p1  ORF type:complete len:597 (+),score=138.21 TRINITY_DN4042_c0_g1_i1:129-1919(+)
MQDNRRLKIELNSNKTLKQQQHIQQLKLKYENSLVKLREEELVRAELVKRAQGVLTAKKELRDMYADLAKEKDRVLAEVQSRSPGILDASEAEINELIQTHAALITLQQEHADLRRQLKDKAEQAKLSSSKKNPLIEKQIAENKKLHKIVNELTEENNDLQIKIREQNRKTERAYEISSPRPGEKAKPLYFVISTPQLKQLMKEIQNLQCELWDLEVKHLQLQENYEELNSTVSNEASSDGNGNVTGDNVNNKTGAVDSVEKEMEQLAKILTDEKAMYYSTNKKYKKLAESVISLQEPLNLAITSSNSDHVVLLLEKLYSIIQGLAIESRVIGNDNSWKYLSKNPTSNSQTSLGSSNDGSTKTDQPQSLHQSTIPSLPLSVISQFTTTVEHHKEGKESKDKEGKESKEKDKDKDKEGKERTKQRSLSHNSRQNTINSSGGSSSSESNQDKSFTTVFSNPKLLSKFEKYLEEKMVGTLLSYYTDLEKFKTTKFTSNQKVLEAVTALGIPVGVGPNANIANTSISVEPQLRKKANDVIKQNSAFLNNNFFDDISQDISNVLQTHFSEMMVKINSKKRSPNKRKFQALSVILQATKDKD